MLAGRGDHPGLIWIFSAMEPGSTFNPRHDKQSSKTLLKPDQSKCLHCYFYLMDEELSLCCVRVPTWLPCLLQVYCNGHTWAALRLKRMGSRTNWWTTPSPKSPIGNGHRTCPIDSWQAHRLHWKLDEFIRRFVPSSSILESPIIGALTWPNLPPTLFSNDTRIWRLCAITRHGRRSIRSNPIPSPPALDANSTATIKTKWETASTIALKAPVSNTPWDLFPSRFTTSSLSSRASKPRSTTLPFSNTTVR